MSIGLYDQLFTYKNGKLLAENVTVKLQLDGQDVDVFTLVKGFSGRTPSPKKVVATLSNVIPATGFEVDTWNDEINAVISEWKFQFGGSGLSLTVEGMVDGNAIEAGVSANAGIDFTVHAGPGSWEGGVGI